MEALDYLRKSENTDRIPWKREGWTIVPYGLLGEVGSLSEVLKKKKRDSKSEEYFALRVIDEVGDILWYLFAAMRRVGVEEIFWPEAATKKIDIYEAMVNVANGAADLASIGSALKDQNIEAKDKILSCAQKILVGLQEIVSHVGYDLGYVAEDAVRKNEAYWGEAKKMSPCFDAKPGAEFPDYERLPRKFKIGFREIDPDSNNPQLIISMNGVQLGDRLTDNTYDETGYRYHDVFHMAGAAFLGWSPVLRRMLKRKRKSDAETDEIEDGARAAIIEEAIVSQVFRYGEQVDFEKVESVDEDLVKLIMEMASEYECKDLEGRDWKLYAIRSIELFGLVRNGFSGVIEFDADTRAFSIIEAGLERSHEQPLHQSSSQR